MVSSVNTNINALAAIQSLNDISSSLTTTQSHIQSGLKVGSASDNPAVFTIAQGLRANVSALSAVSSSLATGIATVQGQTAGASSISSALTTLVNTVTQAQGQTGAALAASNDTITKALGNIDAYAQATTINGVNLLSTATGGGSIDVLSNVNGDATTITTKGNSDSLGLGLTNLAAASTGFTLTAAPVAVPPPATPATPALTSTSTVTIQSAASSVASASTKVTFAAAGSAAVYTASTGGAAATLVVALGADDTGSIANLAKALKDNNIASSVDAKGVLTIAGTGTGAPAAITAVVTNSTVSIDVVNAAITTLGKTLSALGAATVQLQGLSDFTGKLSTSVTTSLGSLVDANLSEESAKLSSLQTKQSLAIQSLSIANQGPGALLQLFR